jgi:hypothetical protein
VAAGIAVQSQWYVPGWDSVHRPGAGLGIAQLSDSEMKQYKLSGDQNDPEIGLRALESDKYEKD